MSKRSVQLKSHAGAGVVQPEPARPGSLIEESRPLQLFLENLPTMRAALAGLPSPSFALSPLNAIPKIALGKWETEYDIRNRVWLVSDAQVDRLIPLGSVGEYYGGVMDRLERGRTVALVPEPIADHVRAGGFKVQRQQVEYLMKTEDIIDPPGSHHGRLRNYLRRAGQSCVVEQFDPAKADEYLALNRTWYRQNASLKFRTYDKTSIDWLLSNWQAVQTAVPDARCVGVRWRETMQLIAFDMGCLLTDEQWTSYTHRFDRNAPVNRVSMFAYAELAKLYPGSPTENQGTADTTSIKAWKSKMAYATQTLFTVST